MQGFIEIYGFLAVVLRGLAIAGQSGAIGGVAFLQLLGSPLSPATSDDAIARPARRLIFLCASCLAVTQLLAAAALAMMLMGTLDLSAADALGADAALVDIASAIIAAGLALWARRPGGKREGAEFFPLLASVALVATQSVSTHAASRPDGALALLAAEILHMSAVGVWIGGIPYFLFALWRTSGAARAVVARRFSLLCVGAVAVAIASGVFMAIQYVQPAQALYGTSYGVMLGAKLILLASLLSFGAINFKATERLRREPTGSTHAMKRFAEAEIGIGLTAMLCAASLTSLPPAADLSGAERASGAEIVERIAPQWPVRLASPDHAALSVAVTAPAQSPSQPQVSDAAARAADVAWSEYNHHWAGLFVMLMGALALLERHRLLQPFARHWPLVFLGLAAFLFLRADEAVWPLGSLGLIESLRDPEITQHRLFVALIIVFGIFEWQVRLGRWGTGWPALVFPLTTAAAAGFLLTHSHGLADPKQELLIEITHTPLALLGVAAGWSRWLELRLPGTLGRIAGFIWPVAFFLAGLTLLFYREA